MKAKTLFLGFVVGGVAAGIATLLSAPASGKDTRKYISIQSKSIALQIKELGEQLKEIKSRLAYVGEEGKEALSTLATDMADSISQWKKDILPHQQELQKEIANIEKSIADLEKTLNVPSK
ncbi:gas vesicle protein [Cytobacillus horneckiae]|uniref:YtxH domain-containing protein n=1 Tax=Cytobacillus horneckiae TaxID=549687 RepID=A0A2N0Z917_9BACI|nr:YtxH domain-containing protein [Cytobacillus horneckiae]NRG44642.1 YtxH domain-containing protein [Bacillus sp. CRN 9]MBN6887648.1 YtxH domain-containing protein [Cytobacillus horneckiae]MCM3178705.1 YtxH domain-containing protein [Cytobacillus horneckiae]MEC1158180.1 YtxH domain-containing protein [Cytobacillus horneckiae]MED2940176.1 YtxH domain-containing protein [Cytobacillus horneckiae]